MLFDLKHPIIQAPMAGGPSTPELAAAVSNSGGLGSLGCAYMTPAQMADAIRATKALTSAPFGVNLFAGGFEHQSGGAPGPMLDLLVEAHRELGLPPPEVPAPADNPFPEQLDVLLETRPAVFSFTFGIPSAQALAQIRARGIAIAGTATTAEEGRLLSDAGVDAIVAQGAEAGAHRGTFAGSFETSMVPVRDLVLQIAHVTKVPVVASGGIMDGREIASLINAGAAAAQLGTAFLASPESGAPPAYKEAVLTATGDSTVVTRAYSGRPARGIANTFIRRLEGREEIILPYPLQNSFTRPMRTAAAKLGKAGFLSLWAGTGVARAGALPAAELVARLAEEMEA